MLYLRCTPDTSRQLPAAPRCFPRRCLIGVFAMLAALTASVTKAETAPATDQQLHEKALEAWQESWNRFYDDGTHLFYDYVYSYDPQKRLAGLPTPDETHRSDPNRNGWGTGMEDCAISGGVILSTICDRFAATGDQHLREAAQKAFAGMVSLGTVSPSEGFVIRGITPVDGQSHYCESSRDQYTWYTYGLWRYYHSPLSSDDDRAVMRKIITAICARLERNVTPEHNYHIGREDGTFDGVVDKMWENAAHEVARLPMIYAIAADMTGQSHWQDLADRYKPEAAAKSKAPSTTIAYALLQQQVSLETLYLLEKSPELKAQWLEAMQLVAERAEGFLPHCRGYQAPDAQQIDLDWRTWPLYGSASYRVPTRPDFSNKDNRHVREPAEAALVLLLMPELAITPEQLALIRQMIAQVDYRKSVWYGLYYTQAVYWRAVRLGLLSLPQDREDDSPPGVVIDKSPDFKQIHVGAPSMEILPDGTYVASHDWFGPAYRNRKVTVVFESKDQGATWQKISEFEGQKGSMMFAVGTKLWHLGWCTPGIEGKSPNCIAIRRSEDGGHTWTAPVDDKSGLLLSDKRYFVDPAPVLFHKGRVWKEVETVGPKDGGKRNWATGFQPIVASAPQDANLLDRRNWTFSNPVPWTSQPGLGGWLEGNVLFTPAGKMIIQMRVDDIKHGGKAAQVQVSDDGKTASFDPATGLVAMPGGCKKFVIKYDDVSQKYWSLVDWVHPADVDAPDKERVRNTLALVCSSDLQTWHIRKIVLRHPSTTIGFQYCDWRIVGDDMVFVCRMAWKGRPELPRCQLPDVPPPGASSANLARTIQLGNARHDNSCNSNHSEGQPKPP